MRKSLIFCMCSVFYLLVNAGMAAAATALIPLGNFIFQALYTAGVSGFIANAVANSVPLLLAGSGSNGPTVLAVRRVQE